MFGDVQNQIDSVYRSNHEARSSETA